VPSRRWSSAISIVASLATFALLAGCGSSGPSATPGSSSAESGITTSSSGSSGSPIVIGNIGGYSGQAASGFAKAEEVIKAWAASVNASGGLNGHPVKLIVKDDASSPAQALTAVKELIEHDHVVAIVSEVSSVDAVWGKYVESTGVPVIGGLPVTEQMVTNPDFFPVGQNTFALLYHAIQLAKTTGPKFGYLYCAEAAVCAEAVPLVTSFAKLIGVQVPVVAKFSATAPDYTAICQQLKDQGVTSYEVAGAPASQVRVSAACVQQGLKAKIIATDGAPDAEFVTAPSLNGTLLAETVYPWYDSSQPAVKSYLDLLAKYAPDVTADDGPTAFYSYIGAKLFEKAVSNIGSGPITPASVKQGLYALKGETLGGITPPLTYSPGKATQINCGYTITLNGGKYSSPDGGKLTCAPDAVISGVLSKLAG